MAACDQTPGLHSTIQYLARSELYRREKPYIANFAVPEGARTTNHEFASVPVYVRNARLEETQLNTHGFTFRLWPTQMQPQDFEDDDIVESIYYKELDSWMRSSFPEYKDIIFLDFKVRKRSQGFPVSGLHKYENAQPLLLAHSDMTAADAINRIESVAPEVLEEHAGKTLEILNVWRVINGPTADWPLGLCDFRTIDPDADLVANDNLLIDGALENLLIHPSAKHQWYYLDQQNADEVAVFRQTSTDPAGRVPIGMHAAFSTPVADQIPRESIEVRLAAFL